MSENIETKTEIETRITIGKPERRITNKQIAAIYAIGKFCKKNYFSVLDRFKELFFTDREFIQRWEHVSLEDRIEISGKHFAGIENRTMADIGFEIAPKISEKCSSSIAKKILVMAIERGDISQEEADREGRYRKSVRLTEVMKRMKIEGRASFNWPEEKIKEYGERIIKNLGLNTYSSEEDNLLLELMQNPEYTHPHGSIYSGHVNWSKIAEEMGRISGENRSKHSIRGRYKRLIKKGKSDDVRPNVQKNYSNEEDSHLIGLTKSPSFRHEIGTRYAGKLHWNRIAIEMNSKFGKNRKLTSFSKRYIQLKKTK